MRNVNKRVPPQKITPSLSHTTRHRSLQTQSRTLQMSLHMPRVHADTKQQQKQQQKQNVTLFRAQMTLFRAQITLNHCFPHLRDPHVACVLACRNSNKHASKHGM